MVIPFGIEDIDGQTAHINMSVNSGKSAITKTDDKGYIIASSLDTDSITEADGYIIRLDSLGNVIWKFFFGDTLIDGFFDVIKSLDQNYVAVGYKNYDFGKTNHSIYLVKITESGNLAWEREFLSDALGYSIQQTYDGGYIISGGKSGDLCLVKTDCMGNSTFWDSTNCPLATGINDQKIINQPSVRISPNPFSSTATLQISSELLTLNSKLEFKMYDVLGREVFQSAISNSQSEIHPNLTSGIYFYQLTSDRQPVVRGKIVKQ